MPTAIHTPGRAGIVLALALLSVAPAFGECTNEDHNRWLTACTEAIYAAKRAGEPAGNPWDIVESTNPVLQVAAGESLGDAVVSACSDPPSIATTCTAEQHHSWLDWCAQDALRLQSQTRAALSKDFVEQGGLSTRFDRDYVHRRCTNLQVRVHFQAIGPPGELGESPSDLILSAVPFLGFVVAD